MAAQPSPLSLHEFHQIYDGLKPAYEYWRGEAVQKSMPTVLHGLVQFLLAMLLEKAGWNVSIKVRLRIALDAEPIPDLIAVQGKFQHGPYPITAPELCVEILSPVDGLSNSLQKGRGYIAWGSRSVWIIDPQHRTAWNLSSEQPAEPIWVPPSGTLKIGATTIELNTLFAAVDSKLETAGSEIE